MSKYVISYRNKPKKGKRKRKVKLRPSWDRLNKAKSDETKALIFAEDMTGNKNLKVQRIRIPPNLKGMAEKELKAKLKLKPKVYVYEPKRGHKIRKTKDLGIELGATHMAVDKKIIDGGEVYTPTDPYIIIPKSHLKDKKIRDIVIAHELGETLALQEEMKRPTTHQRALEVEKRLEKQVKMERPEVLKRAEELYKDQDSWRFVGWRKRKPVRRKLR